MNAATDIAPSGRSSGKPSFLRASPASARVLPWLLLAVVVGYGAALRAYYLGATRLWTDEAETSINALTILQHGVPVDQYLGLPIFENTLTEPWRENPEYEFRDTSYSRRGLAIYHGWLPLYVVAASFALTGVDPDEPRPDLAVRHSVEEMYRRTVAARIPAVAFGVLFLVAIFLAGRGFYGEDAGWAAVAPATVSTTIVNLARQARYYSLTLALSALCALMISRMMARGRRRDFAVGGVLLVLLFHTNLLAFASTCGVLGLAVPYLLRHDRIVSKLALLAAIITSGTLPWVLATGFLSSATDRPMARSLVGFEHIVAYATDRLPFALLGTATLAWLVVMRLFRDRLPARVVGPFAGSRPRLLFLTGWALCGFLAFNFLIPAASYFHTRLTLIILVPSLLFGAMLFAAIGRTVAPRHSSLVAPALALLLLFATGRTTFWWPDFVPGRPFIFNVIEHLRSLELAPDTRLYADTGTSLPLQFYTGLPFQNVMPVRRSFLDDYPGELLIVEGPRGDMLSWPEVRDIASEAGVTLTEPVARRTARRFNEEMLQAALEGRVARLSPPRQPIPDPELFARLAAHQRRKTRLGVADMIEESRNPMFDGIAIEDYTTLWQVFFYRFVDPAARMGAALNYANRIRSAEAVTLPGSWAIIRCPPLPAYSSTSDTGSTSRGRAWR